MAKNVLMSFVLFVLVGVGPAAFGQTSDSMKPSMLSGDVTAIADRTITVKMAATQFDAIISDTTEFKRVAAVNPSLKTATAAVISDIKVGDKVIVSGIPAADGKTVPALRVYLISKTDIAQRDAKDLEEWRTRGITGKITALDPQAKTITVETSGLMGSSTTVLTPKPNAMFHRYATDSIKATDAKAGTFADIQKGDQIRAKGDKSADGATFAAEDIFSGSFQTIAGTVKSIDAANSEVVITDLTGKKDFTISFAKASVMKLFPADIAERMVGMQMGAGGARPVGAAGGATPPNGGAKPVGAPGGNAQGGGAMPAGGPRPGGMGGPRGGIDDMLERFPNITAADLKVGQMIGILTSAKPNASPTEKLTAFKLIAGVEPFVKLAQARAAMAGAGRQGAQPGLSIPGLDGFGAQ